MTPLPPELTALLHAIADAVRDGDGYHAHMLAQRIRQQIARDPALPDSVEQQVRALLAELRVDENLDAIEAIRHNDRTSEPGVEYPVWFGTNRKPTADRQGFSHERHDMTTLGRVRVHVPAAHRFGETGNSFWRRLLRRDLRDDRLRLTQVETQAREDWFDELLQTTQLARDAGETPHALVFIHGYNTTFADAAIRAAQIGYDLKVLGPTAFFAWPSFGRVIAYPADEAAIEASEGAIAEFLVDFAAHCGAERLHVIAHSMGNRGLLRALQRISGRVRFAQIVLAAPDVDRGLFLDLANLFPDHSARTTLYTSAGDRAVHLSAIVHASPRAGYFKPHTVAPGIDTIAVPDFDLELLGHGYFAQASALLHDIHVLMRYDTAPMQRQCISPARDNDTTFWQLAR